MMALTDAAREKLLAIEMARDEKANRRKAGLMLVGFVVLGVVLALLTGCGLPPDVVQELEEARAAFKELSVAGDSSPKEQTSATAAYDALSQAGYRAGWLDELPADTKARRAARKLRLEVRELGRKEREAAGPR